MKKILVDGYCQNISRIGLVVLFSLRVKLLLCEGILEKWKKEQNRTVKVRNQKPPATKILSPLSRA